MGRFFFVLALISTPSFAKAFEDFKMAGFVPLAIVARGPAFIDASSILIPIAALELMPRLGKVQIPNGDGLLIDKLRGLSGTGTVTRDQLLAQLKGLTEKEISGLTALEIEALYRAILAARIPHEPPSRSELEAKLLAPELVSQMNDLRGRLSRASASRGGPRLRGLMHDGRF